MLYLRERGGGTVEHVVSSRARPSKYDKYDAPIAMSTPGTTAMSAEATTTIEDDDGDGDCLHSSDMVIWPECWTHLIDSLQPSRRGADGDEDNDGDDDFGKEGEWGPAGRQRRRPRRRPRRRSEREYQIAIWWLSVDNNRGMFNPNDFATRGDVLHLVQSAYAREYVQSQLGNVHERDDEKLRGRGGTKDEGCGKTNDRNDAVLDLTEFISSHASSSSSMSLSSTTPTSCTRDVDVAYNPAKGMHYTDQIIRRAVGGRRGRGRMVVGSEVVGGGASDSDRGADDGEGRGSMRFVPIGLGPDGRGRMTGEEVAALLGRSKVVSVPFSQAFLFGGWRLNDS
jgi:hypothetical protein